MPYETLVIAGIISTGFAVTLLIAQAPAAGVPVGAGATVAGFLFSIWSWVRSR